MTKIQDYEKFKKTGNTSFKVPTPVKIGLIAAAPFIFLIFLLILVWIVDIQMN